MPINVYTGLMRSGKSYEVVAEVIVPAVAQGRRVVTNVDGISNELVCTYVHEKFGTDVHKLGSVVHVTNADVAGADFFPHYDDKKDFHVNTIVQPGDLVVIDEAWRFWPATGGKIIKEHQSFFLEHGHFTHADTGVCCDLVLMIQDMGTLNRHLKAVVAFSFRTHKKVSLGLGKVYSCNMFEGYKQTGASEIGTWVRKYKAEIFPLYSSFAGGADGRTVNVDSRQNIFGQKKLWVVAVAMVLIGGWSVRTVWSFFHPKDDTAKTAQAPSGVPSASAVPPAPSKPAVVPFSEVWRVSGSFSADGHTWVVLVDPAGTVRLESPSMFGGAGMVQVGQVDGSRVTAFSGVSVRPSGAAMPPPASSTEVRK